MVWLVQSVLGFTLVIFIRIIKVVLCQRHGALPLLQILATAAKVLKVILFFAGGPALPCSCRGVAACLCLPSGCIKVTFLLLATTGIVVAAIVILVKCYYFLVLLVAVGPTVRS